jgi:hypothetical protein
MYSVQRIGELMQNDQQLTNTIEMLTKQFR